MPKGFIETMVDHVLSRLKPGKKIIIERSNETMHLDPETGEMVSDSYEHSTEEWNAKPNLDALSFDEDHNG